MNLLLEKLREKYLEKVIENSKRKKIANELEELKEKEDVKRYLELIKLLDKNPVDSDDYLLNMTFNKKKECEQFNCNIYVYYGAYYETNSFIYLDGRLTGDRVNCDYMLYRNLLDFSDMNKILTDNNNFYKDKVIIEFSDSYFNKREDYEEACNKLRAFYCKRLLEGISEEEILDEIVKNKENFNISLVSYNGEVLGEFKKKKK